MDGSGSEAINVYEHCTVVDRKKGRVACNYCGKVVSGSFRLKCHVGGIRGDVVPCPTAPADVRELMRNRLMERKRETFGMEHMELHFPDLPRRMNSSPSSNGIKHNKPQTSQTSGSQNGSQEQEEMEFSLEDGETGNVFVSNGSRGSKRGGNEETIDDTASRKAGKCIGRFLYETGLEFAAANSPSFKNMIHSTLGPGLGEFKIPSYEELRGWILEDEVKEVTEYVTKIRKSWATTGCSILLDSWIDEKGRKLVNFLVNCPEGAIYLCTHDISSFDIDAIYSLLEEIMKDVGVENVVQVVADSTTGWAGIGEEDFNNRFKGVFWGVSASHCIELILEKIGMMGSVKRILDKAKVITKFIHGHSTVLKLLKKHNLGRDLIQPSKIRSAMPVMTLKNILSEKQNLKDMFSSSEWNMSPWASRAEGKRVADLVEDHSFWTGARMVLKAAMPLIRILDLIFKADKPLVGYIYETMDQVKETIQEEFKNEKSKYMPFWIVIDEIWDNHLHSPLHGAAYYLNPSLFYTKDFNGDPEVAFALLYSLVQMVQHYQTQVLISRQFSKYRLAKGSFQEGRDRNQGRNIPPGKRRYQYKQMNKGSSVVCFLILLQLGTKPVVLRSVKNQDLKLSFYVKLTAAIWWSCYGHQCPELQRFAIRILSQNCDGASKYGLKRTLAEKLVTNGRNPIEQQRLKDLAFVHYNLHLQQFCSGVKTGIVAEEIDPMDDWIIDEAPDIEPQTSVSWMNLDYTRGAIDEEGLPRTRAKTEFM